VLPLLLAFSALKNLLTRVSFLDTLEAGGGTSLVPSMPTSYKPDPPYAPSVPAQRRVVNRKEKEKNIGISIDQRLLSGTVST